MNKEIEEMMLTVPQKIVAYDGNPAGQHLYREQRQEIAEALYNAGYRKVGSDAKGNLLKIQNLCIEFDEMGYEPTTLCENPEGKAKLWKSALVYEIGLLLDEYAAIKEKAVKEFAGKIKAKLNAIFGKTICSDLDTEDITDIIDELLKEYENGKDKD